MKTKYHIEITELALRDHFSPGALAEIVNANIRQDKIANQFGHDEIHFDGSAFKQGFAYIDNQLDIILQNIITDEYLPARQAFGRMLHSWQDFYSHSNYVELWLAKHPDAQPEGISHNDGTILSHPELKSGKNYGLIEFIAMIPGIASLVIPRMPTDSHAKMNHDAPQAHPNFYFSYWAAVYKTKAITEDLLQGLYRRGFKEQRVRSFTGK